MGDKSKLYVCTEGKKCPRKGGDDILRELRKQAEECGLDVKIKSSDCLKLCKHAPAVLSEPLHVAYGELKVSDCRDVVKAHAKGEEAEHLVVKRKGKKKKKK